MPVSKTEPSKTSVWQPVMVTIIALVVYRLGTFIPIPGLNLEFIASATHGMNAPGALERLSILALGAVPWLSALTLTEFAILCLPDLRETWLARDGHADPFSRWVISVSLVFAAFQSFGVSHALQEIDGLVIEPGGGFVLTAMASLMAGVALTIALARVIDAAGIGHGLWVLLASALLGTLPAFFAQGTELLRTGAVSTPVVFVCLAALAAVMAAIVALLMARAKSGLVTFQPLVWPIILSSVIAGWLVAILMIATLKASDMGTSEPMGGLGHFNNAVVIGLTVLFAAVYLRREGSTGLMGPAIALLILMLLLDWSAAYFLPLAAIPNSTLFVPLVAVLLPFAQELADRLANSVGEV